MALSGKQISRSNIYGYSLGSRYAYVFLAVAYTSLSGCALVDERDQLFVAQFHPDGSRDRDFFDDVHTATAGVSFRRFPDAGAWPTAFDLAVDGTGRIVAAGISSIGDDWLAAGFRGDGRPSYAFYESDLDVVGNVTVAIDPSNRPVLAGPALVRLTPSGRPDPTWGSGGRVALADPVNDVATDSLGRVYVTGTTQSSGRKELMVDRYDTDGRIDRTFGIDGRATISLRREAVGHAIALDAMGRVVVAGRLISPAVPASESEPDLIIVARFLARGFVDATFGTGGGALTFAVPPRPTAPFVRTVMIDSSQRIRLLGNRSTLIGLTSNGRLDTGFGVGGLLPASGVEGIAIDASDRIYSVSTRYEPDDSGYQVAVIRRYDGTTGRHDLTFPAGAATEVVLQLGPDRIIGLEDVRGASIAIGRYGDILIGGNATH